MSDVKIDFNRAVVIPSVAANQEADWHALNRMGIYAGLGGGDRGFNEDGDVLTQLSDGASLDALWTEDQRAGQLHVTLQTTSLRAGGRALA